MFSFFVLLFKFDLICCEFVVRWKSSYASKFCVKILAVLIMRLVFCFLIAQLRLIEKERISVTLVVSFFTVAMAVQKLLKRSVSF